MKNLIKKALILKAAAGKGGWYSKGQMKRKRSKRQKMRDYFAAHPEVTPWPLRARAKGPADFTPTDFSDAAKKERRSNGGSRS